MKLKKITTSDITEIQQFIPDYQGGNLTRRLHPDGSLVALNEVEETITHHGEDGEEFTETRTKMVTEPYEHISGNRVDIYDKGLEVIEQGEYDEDGNETKAPVYGDRIFEIEMPEYISIP